MYARTRGGQGSIADSGMRKSRQNGGGKGVIVPLLVYTTAMVKLP